MADPLTEVVDKFAPAPLNVFDQDFAETVISRQANAKRGVESSAGLADSRRRAYDEEQATLRAERDRMLLNREDEEYTQKKEADAMRGEILADLYENLRPNEEGYDERATQFLSQAPASVVKDPVFNEVLRGLSGRADKAEAERVKQREADERQANTIAAIRERAKYGETMKYLTEADLKELPRDEAGEIIMSFEAGVRAAERKRQAGIEDFTTKAGIKQEAAKELLNTKNMDVQQRELYQETKDILINDMETFPTQISSVIAKAAGQGASTDVSLLKKMPKYADEVRKAEAWDKNQFENEVLTAKKYDTPDEYVELVPGLSPNAAGNRRRVWEYAHKNDAPAPAPAAKTAAPAAAAPAPAAPAAAAPAPAAPAAAAPAPAAKTADYGKRPDGTNKGTGFFGELKLPDGSVATEYSTQSDAVKVNGQRVDFPTLVPTLSPSEVERMTNDIIPNKKPIPESIMRKAIDHANGRISKGFSVFADASLFTESTLPDGTLVRVYEGGRVQRKKPKQ
jgi:hypothetical protein